MSCLLALFLVASSNPALPANQDILLSKADRNGPPTLLFISQPRLAQLSKASSGQLSNLPISPAAVLEQIGLAKASFAADGCTESVRGDSLGSSPGAGEIPSSAFNTEPVSFVGKVVSVTPGWVPYKAAGDRGQVYSLTVVSVVEVLRDASHSLHPGAEVSFLQFAGSFMFEGVRFCTHNPEISMVSVGDEIAVAAEFDEINPSFLITDSARHVFALKDDLLVPIRPFHAGEKVPSIPLSEARRFAQAESGQR